MQSEKRERKKKTYRAGRELGEQREPRDRRGWRELGEDGRGKEEEEVWKGKRGRKHGKARSEGEETVPREKILRAFLFALRWRRMSEREEGLRRAELSAGGDDKGEGYHWPSWCGSHRLHGLCWCRFYFCMRVERHSLWSVPWRTCDMSPKLFCMPQSTGPTADARAKAIRLNRALRRRMQSTIKMLGSKSKRIFSFGTSQFLK